MEDRSALPPPQPTDDSPDDAPEAEAIDLSALSIAGITRRRVGWVGAGLIATWIVILVARQAGDAAAIAVRADQIGRDNVALAAEVASLERELRMVEDPDYVSQQARAYSLGSTDEIPFTLDRSVPEPGPNAPGSASLRVGADGQRVSPLESWMSLLFGPIQ